MKNKLFILTVALTFSVLVLGGCMSPSSENMETQIEPPSQLSMPTQITEHCIDCLLSRVNLECTLCHATTDLTKTTINECSSLMDEIRSSPLSHPQIASRIHRRAYEILNNPDPFAELKILGNRQARDVCREVQKDLFTFRDYVLASVIGNTFDYGVKGHTVEENFSVFFRREFTKGFTIDDTDKIAPLCSRVVYLSDNCGEIVFDYLLINYLKQHGSHVTLAVKESHELRHPNRKAGEERSF